MCGASYWVRIFGSQRSRAIADVRSGEFPMRITNRRLDNRPAPCIGWGFMNSLVGFLSCLFHVCQAFAGGQHETAAFTRPRRLNRVFSFSLLLAFAPALIF